MTVTASGDIQGIEPNICSDGGFKELFTGGKRVGEVAGCENVNS